MSPRAYGVVRTCQGSLANELASCLAYLTLQHRLFFAANFPVVYKIPTFTFSCWLNM